MSITTSSIKEQTINAFYSSDLKTMSDRFKANYYSNKRLFIADLRRMFANCRGYNAPDTEYYNCANVLEKYVNAKLR